MGPNREPASTGAPLLAWQGEGGACPESELDAIDDTEIAAHLGGEILQVVQMLRHSLLVALSKRAVIVFVTLPARRALRVAPVVA